MGMPEPAYVCGSAWKSPGPGCLAQRVDHAGSARTCPLLPAGSAHPSSPSLGHCPPERALAITLHEGQEAVVKQKALGRVAALETLRL